jgi:hypothetical protein
VAKDPLEGQTVPSKAIAEKLSEMLGCSGAHKIGDAWGPCESDKDLKKLLELGNPEFREWKKRQSEKTGQKLPKGAFASEDLASREAVNMGCSGAHMSRQGVWFPCANPEEYNAARAHAGVGGSNILRASRPTRRVISDRKHWEKLRGRGISGIETMPGGGLVSAKASDSFPDSFKPTSGMVTAAKRGLEMRKEHGRGGTMVGVARARDIANGKNLSLSTVKRMYSFFARHEVDKRAEGFRKGEKGWPSAGKVAWDLWGGDAGFTWSKSIVERAKKRKKSDLVGFDMYPTQEMIASAKMGIRLRDAHNIGASLKDIVLGKKIARGDELSEEDIVRMQKFFVIKDPVMQVKSDSPSMGSKISWLIHGGNAGYKFARSKSLFLKSDIQKFSESYYEKRFYTRERRTEYAKRGWALPDGSFPIRDVGDLRNAIQAYGLGKNQAAAKRHIMKRARALKRTDLIPENWEKKKKTEESSEVEHKAKKPKRGGDPKTPAKPSERIRGSARNKPGSASGTRGKISLSDSVIKSLQTKVKEHNEKMEKAGKKDRKVTLGMLKSVWRRGAGAFSASHRPGMGRQQWAMGRVNAFLKLVSSGKPKNAKYTTDNDLLPKKHPRSTRK